MTEVVRPNMDPQVVAEMLKRYGITDDTGYTAPVLGYMVAGDPHSKSVQWPPIYKLKDFRAFGTKLQELRQWSGDTITERAKNIFRSYTIGDGPGVAIIEPLAADKRPKSLQKMHEVTAIATLAETPPETLLELCGSLAVAGVQLQDEVRAKAEELGLNPDLGPSVGGLLWVPSAPQEWQALDTRS
ncbi:MAG TPA: hypothetical protein VD735_02850 [Candidatus Saccharimonadales bacterium]|nr:hypothetical protein [Candidatus Saccharimonadales bacterium]